jgi:hypothetical protein
MPIVSRWVRVQAMQLDEAAHVVGEVLHPDLRLRPHHVDGAHRRATHVVGLRTEDMPDPRAQLGFHVVGPIRRIGTDPRAGVALHQQMIDLLAVVQGGIAEVIALHQLVWAALIQVFHFSMCALILGAKVRPQGPK